MSKPKKQHVIPKAYLNWFQDPDNRITVFSKRQKKHLRPYPKDALTRYHYYSQPENGEHNAKQELEVRFFGRVENELPKFKDQLLETKQVDLELMLEVMFSMALRTTAFRETFELGLSDFVNRHVEGMDKSALPQPPKGFENLFDSAVVTIDPHRSIHAMRHYLEAYVRIITQFNYRVFTAPKNKNLLTSDNPVLWVDNLKSPTFPVIYPRVVTETTRVLFPISPTKILVGKPSLNNNVGFLPEGGNLTAKQTNLFNALQIACSWDFTIGKAKVPKKTHAFASSVAPKFKVDLYNPDDNTFIISETSLSGIRSKPKYRTD